MDDYSEPSALEQALEDIIGEQAAELAVTARESTSFTIDQGQTWVLVIAVFLVALGGIFKNLRGVFQVLAESWKEEQEFRREFKRQKLEQNSARD